MTCVFKLTFGLFWNHLIIEQTLLNSIGTPAWSKNMFIGKLNQKYFTIFFSSDSWKDGPPKALDCPNNICNTVRAIQYYSSIESVEIFTFFKSMFTVTGFLQNSFFSQLFIQSLRSSSSETQGLSFAPSLLSTEILIVRKSKIQRFGEFDQKRPKENLLIS